MGRFLYIILCTTTAMMAYAKCQFTKISTEEIASLRAALLKYCELDTLAMVMLWQT